MNIKIKSTDIDKWFKSFSGDLKIRTDNRWITINTNEGDAESILKNLKTKTPFEFEFDTSEQRLINPTEPFDHPEEKETVTQWAKRRRQELNDIDAAKEVEEVEAPEEELEGTGVLVLASDKKV